MVDEQRVVQKDEELVVQRTSEPAPSTTPPSDTPPSEAPSGYGAVTRGTVVEESVRHTPSQGEVARRVVVFLFGIVQALIGLRIVLLLADASQGNGIVRFIYDLSAFFVAPFEGVLHTNAVQAGASVLDVAALVAIVGWTILEVLIIAGLGILRREP